MQRIILLVSLFLISFVQEVTAQEAHTITVEFIGMESDKGNLYVALYNKEKDFLKKSIKGEIVKITDKKATAVFKNIPEGEYAISAFHDENDNKKMDTKIFGIPKEPIGMSNDAKGFMGPPKYKDAKFSVNGNVSLKITMN
jgi:uncharacterized protein (DUF2141 family)